MERRGDDRQQGDDAQRPLYARAGAALGEQRHHRAEHGGAEGRGQGEEQRVPGDTALPRQLFQMRLSASRRKIADSAHCPSSLMNAPDSALATGKAMNSASSAEQQTTAEATNRSPSTTETGQAERRDHHQGEQYDETAHAHAELVDRQFAKICIEPFERPASCADQETATA